MQKNAAKGDWCWLAEGRKNIDCKLVNGKTLFKKSWARCDDKGSAQLVCQGNFCLLIRNILRLKNFKYISLNILTIPRRLSIQVYRFHPGSGITGFVDMDLMLGTGSEVLILPVHRNVMDNAVVVMTVLHFRTVLVRSAICTGEDLIRREIPERTLHVTSCLEVNTVDQTNL